MLVEKKSEWQDPRGDHEPWRLIGHCAGAVDSGGDDGGLGDVAEVRP